MQTQFQQIQNNNIAPQLLNAQQIIPRGRAVPTSFVSQRLVAPQISNTTPFIYAQPPTIAQPQINFQKRNSAPQIIQNGNYVTPNMIAKPRGSMIQ